MAIAHYIKEIGRGKEGARSLSRAQSCDLMLQILDGGVSDLEIGGFCLAMRIKGETTQEMLGFLDAVHSCLQKIPNPHHQPVVVIPSYNGARKLPVLTPLLAASLARAGLAVLVHGCQTEDKRVSCADVFKEMGIEPLTKINAIEPGVVAYTPTALLCPALKKLLDVRRIVGLRNPAHSLVKLMMPVDGEQYLVTSYTHPEYATSMSDTLQHMKANALLLRGTEGEPVADPRRTPQMQWIQQGQIIKTTKAAEGPIAQVPQLPAIDAKSTARYILEKLGSDTNLQIQGILSACGLEVV